jgi:hypothetical protein
MLPGAPIHVHLLTHFAQITSQGTLPEQIR